MKKTKPIKKSDPPKRAKKTQAARTKKTTRTSRARKVSALALKKNAVNPILAPRRENDWEAWQTFNPGAILLDERVHFLYRAVGTDGISRLGYAFSDDGFYVDGRLSFPVYEHEAGERSHALLFYSSGGSWGGAEDPRIVLVEGEDMLYMTYTAVNGDLRVGLASIAVDDFLNKRWDKWNPPVMISSPGEVHKNWVIFPEKIGGKYAILHSLNPEVSVAYVDSLDCTTAVRVKSCYGGAPRTHGWDKWVRGAGAVPIKTKYGWLIFYHAMDDDWSKYKVGAMLLDLHDPTKVLARAQEPVLTPSEYYEHHGFKPGVVYVSGAVVKGDELLVYYGGADSYVCVAHANFDKFVEALKNEKQSKLSEMPVKKN